MKYLFLKYFHSLSLKAKTTKHITRKETNRSGKNGPVSKTMGIKHIVYPIMLTISSFEINLI